MNDALAIKAALCHKFRFEKAHTLIATECGRFNADFLAMRKGVLTEVEVKLTKSDFQNDFKKAKHRYYKQRTHTDFVPHYFYFCVPPELLAYAAPKCLKHNYGLMVWTKNRKNNYFLDEVKVVKRAKRLHDHTPSQHVMWVIISRLSSEMTRLRINNTLDEIKSGESHGC